MSDISQSNKFSSAKSASGVFEKFDKETTEKLSESLAEVNRNVIA